MNFSVQVDAAGATNPANYNINNGQGSPASVVLNTTNSVIITPSSPLTSNTQYTVTVTGLDDCSGLGSINPNANTASFIVTEPAEPFDLMINEIMADPSPPVILPEAEYIEIYNRSSKAINLENYTVSSGSTPQLLPAYILLPGEYVVVCDDGDVVDFQNLAINNVIGVGSFPSLSNDGDVVTLTDDMLTLINEVNYDRDWYQDGDKDDGGYSLELINPENPCDISAANWRVTNSSTGGTPGLENSIFDTSTGTPALQVISGAFLNPSQVVVNFSSSLDVTDAIDPTNYTIDNGVGNPTTVTLTSASSVVLEFATPLSGNILYTVTVAGVNNCNASQSIDPNANTASFKLPEPEVINAIIQDPSQTVVITFDTPMDPATVGDPNNYFIDGLGNPTSVNVVTALVVELTYPAGSFENGGIYDLEVSNVTNLDGTAIIPVTVPIVYYIPVAIERYDIIINEFMADPTDRVGLPEAEFVELYNRSDKIISVEGFTLVSGTSSSSSFPLIVLNPDDYLIVYKDEEGISFDNFGTNAPLASYSGLSNAGDDVALVAPNDEVIDALEFDLTWYQNTAKDDGGYSLERISPFSPCEGAENWRVSADTLGGTPGSRNSIFEELVDDNLPDITTAFPNSGTNLVLSFTEALDLQTAADPSNYSIDNGITVIAANPIPPLYDQVELELGVPLQENTLYEVSIASTLTDCIGNEFGMINTALFGLPETIEEGDIIINEVLFDPAVGGVDYVELYNNSNKYMNIGDLVILNDVAGSSPSKLIEHNYLLFPQAYVVLTPNPADIIEKYTVQNENVLLKNDLPTLSPDFGNVTLVTIGNVIDKFDYKEDYHFELIDETKGVSLERIDFDVFTNTPDNWHSASTNAGYGTPTYVNSQYLSSETTGSDIFTLEDNTFSPDNDGFRDFLKLDYALDGNDYAANINVYDAKGRKIRDLVENETLGAEGFIQWDGINNDGEKARIGIYVLWIELFKPNGDKQYLKKTCVLGGQF